MIFSDSVLYISKALNPELIANTLKVTVKKIYSNIAGKIKLINTPKSDPTKTAGSMMLANE